MSTKNTDSFSFFTASLTKRRKKIMSQEIREKFGRGITSDEFIKTGIVRTITPTKESTDVGALLMHADNIDRQKEVTFKALDLIYKRLIDGTMSKRYAKLEASKELVSYLSVIPGNANLVKLYMDIVTYKPARRKEFSAEISKGIENSQEVCDDTRTM
jgi:hypothetical protein